jgi:hypothetical protein
VVADHDEEFDNVARSFGVVLQLRLEIQSQVLIKYIKRMFT